MQFRDHAVRSDTVQNNSCHGNSAFPSPVRSSRPDRIPPGPGPGRGETPRLLLRLLPQFQVTGFHALCQGRIGASGVKACRHHGGEQKGARKCVHLQGCCHRREWTGCRPHGILGDFPVPCQTGMRGAADTGQELPPVRPSGRPPLPAAEDPGAPAQNPDLRNARQDPRMRSKSWCRGFQSYRVRPVRSPAS